MVFTCLGVSPFAVEVDRGVSPRARQRYKRDQMLVPSGELFIV